MQRSFALATALALGATLGVGTASSYALWQDEIVLSTTTITAGYIHFAVDDPHNDPAAMNSITAAGESLAWTLPPEVLQNLAPGAPQAAVVQIDAQSQGNRGLAYSLSGVEVIGDASLAEAVDLRLTPVADPAHCVADTADGAALTLYADKLIGAAFAPRELVTSEYTEAPWTDPETEYLCLNLSVSDITSEVSGTATVTGMATGGAEPDVQVSAADRWSGTSVPPESARSASVELAFDYQTYRPGGL